MRRAPMRRRFLRLTGGLLLVVGLLLFWQFTARRLLPWRVERAIARFEAAPSQARADRLVDFLQAGAATQAQGERILTMLRWPKITTRSAYPVGQPATLAVETPYRVDRSGMAFSQEQSVWAGEDQIAGVGNSGELPSPMALTAWLLPTEPGVYRSEFRFECEAKGVKQRKTLLEYVRGLAAIRLQGRTLPDRPVEYRTAYRCRFSIPVEVNVVEKSRAETLELVADPQTDKAVRAAVTVEVIPKHGAYPTPSGRRSHEGSMKVTMRPCPVATAFRLSLRLPDGREFPQRGRNHPQQCRLGAGRSGKWMVDMWNLGIEEPGEYSGTLVFQTDPNCAYDDPTIKSVWNGTLEFPVSFRVYTMTRTR